MWGVGCGVWGVGCGGVGVWGCGLASSLFSKDPLVIRLTTMWFNLLDYLSNYVKRE